MTDVRVAIWDRGRFGLFRAVKAVPSGNSADDACLGPEPASPLVQSVQGGRNDRHRSGDTRGGRDTVWLRRDRTRPIRPAPPRAAALSGGAHQPLRLCGGSRDRAGDGDRSLRARRQARPVRPGMGDGVPAMRRDHAQCGRARPGGRRRPALLALQQGRRIGARRHGRGQLRLRAAGFDPRSAQRFRHLPALLHLLQLPLSGAMAGLSRAPHGGRHQACARRVGSAAAATAGRQGVPAALL